MARLLSVLAAALACVLGVAAVFVGEGSVRLPRKPLPHIERAETVEIRSFDGLKLRASHFRSPTPQGVVVLLHGQGDNRAGVSGFAPFLVPAGYSALAPDLRAHGESGGELATYGLLEADDLRRWLDWIALREPGTPIFGLGKSMGAGILLHSLAAEARFCAVVAEAPFASLRAAARDRAGVAGWGMVELASLYQRARYGLDLTGVSPEEAVARSQTPVLLIYGSATPQRHSGMRSGFASGILPRWNYGTFPAPDIPRPGALREWSSKDAYWIGSTDGALH